jgi:uncharacterized membrane protein (UPF0127 family)
VSGDWRRRLGRYPAVELRGGLRLFEARGVNARRRGLGRMTDLPDDCALLLRTRAVHTFTMRFHLDLIWIGAAGEVLRIDRDVSPRRHRACPRARAVIETRAGHADRFISAGLGGYTSPC